ncbi:MAG: demethoxyubiquinone hydroxylase family protein [Bacillota bacterium]
MEKDKLHFKLKEFHSLEVYQVDMFNNQIDSIEDPHAKSVYERFVVREQEHVEFYQRILAEIKEPLPQLINSAFAAAGFVTGKALGLLSIKEKYKMGLAVEKMAVEMYHGFILDASEDPRLAELVKNLQYYMVDEELHRLWFKEQLSRIES